MPAELIKAGGSTICCAIHKLIIAIWNKEELPGEWKESIIVPIHKKGEKTGCNTRWFKYDRDRFVCKQAAQFPVIFEPPCNYRGITLFQTTYKILSNILLSRLIPYAEEIIGDH